MSRFKVEWENELDNPSTPLEAAQEAALDIANGESMAFTVTDLKTGQRYSVDLNESKGDEVTEIGDSEY